MLITTPRIHYALYQVVHMSWSGYKTVCSSMAVKKKETLLGGRFELTRNGSLPVEGPLLFSVSKLMAKLTIKMKNIFWSHQWL